MPFPQCTRAQSIPQTVHVAFEAQLSHADDHRLDALPSCCVHLIAFGESLVDPSRLDMAHYVYSQTRVDKQERWTERARTFVRVSSRFRHQQLAIEKLSPTHAVSRGYPVLRIAAPPTLREHVEGTRAVLATLCRPEVCISVER